MRSLLPLSTEQVVVDEHGIRHVARGIRPVAEFTAMGTSRPLDPNDQQCKQRYEEGKKF